MVGDVGDEFGDDGEDGRGEREDVTRFKKVWDEVPLLVRIHFVTQEDAGRDRGCHSGDQ